jgi:hypothetical protein
MPSIGYALSSVDSSAPNHTGSVPLGTSMRTPLGSGIRTTALSRPPTNAAAAISTKVLGSSSAPTVTQVFCWLRHADSVAGGRSFVRQNSLTLWPLFSYRASQSAFSAAVQFTLVRGFAADWVATVNAFVISQVLLNENLRCHISADQISG